MNQEYNNRTYAIIPTEKANLYIKSNFEGGRFSSDGNSIIWDQAWDPQTLEAIKKDKDVKLINHKAALALMNTPEWKSKDEQWQPSTKKDST